MAGTTVTGQNTIFKGRWIQGFPGNSVVKNLPAIWETKVQSLVRKIPWRRKWQPTPVFFPGKSHGQRKLADYNPWSGKELDTT